MSRSQHDNNVKTGYATLGEALRAKAGIRKSRGNRFRELRPYQDSDGRWYLTKMSKEHFRKFRTK